MNAHDLLDYHLGQLETDHRLQFEAELSQDPKLSRTSQLLGQRLSLLLDEGEPPEPPAGLVGRTVFKVLNLEASPSVLPMPGGYREPSFRWADVAVAAIVLIAGLGALLPAIEHSRRNRTNLQCISNLMNLGQGLNSFASGHGKYPGPASKTSLVASYMFPLLETSTISSPSVLTCPSSGMKPVSLTEANWKSWQTNPNHPPSEFHEFAKRIYSYNPGYELGDGRTGPLSWEERISRNQPLAADSVCKDHSDRVLPGNSLNHGGRGQYVLYTDGGVRYLTQRNVAGDQDIYLNDQKQLNYGLHDHDIVLFPGDTAIERVK